MANPNQNNPFPFNQPANPNENPNDPTNYNQQPNQLHGFANFARPQAGSSSQTQNFVQPAMLPYDSYMGLLLSGQLPTAPQFGFAVPQFGYGVPQQFQQMQSQVGTPTTPNTPSTPTTPYPNSSHGTNVGIPTDDSEIEVVPETQPDVDVSLIEKRRRSKKKLEPDAEECYPGVAIRWDVDEILCLAKCFLNISEDEVIGNAQRSADFWLRILKEFHKQRGRKYRNRDMLISKWRETAKRITVFNGIISGITRDSGCSDGDKTAKAMRLYKLQMGHEWGLHSVWQYCSTHPRWQFIASSSSQSSGSKRAREAEASETIESQPQPQPQRKRPVGRTKAKNAAKAGEGSSEPEAAGVLDRHVENQSRRLEIELLRVQELQRQNQNKRDWKIINTDLNKFPEGEIRDRFYAKQLEAMDRLGLN